MTHIFITKLNYKHHKAISVISINIWNKKSPQTKVCGLMNLIKNYFPLTIVLNFLPAEKAGTVLAAILISLPV